MFKHWVCNWSLNDWLSNLNIDNSTSLGSLIDDNLCLQKALNIK